VREQRGHRDALVPLLSLGIPGSNSAAVLLGGFLVHGLQPGPMLFEKAPEVVYGLYGGLLIANIAMVAIGLVILTPCIWLVNRPKPWLIAFVLALVVTGVYSVHQSVFEVGLVLGVGVVGYILRACKVPPLPMVLGVVLGFMIESNYRRSLLLSGGDSASSTSTRCRSACCLPRQRWPRIRCGANSANARSGACGGSRDMSATGQTDASPTIAERVAAVIAGLPRLTPPAMEATCGSLLVDTAGCASPRATATSCAPCWRRPTSQDRAPVIGQPERRSVAMAALCNGTAAHGEDFDDTYEGGPVHAGRRHRSRRSSRRRKRTASRVPTPGSASQSDAKSCAAFAPSAPKRVHQAGFHPTAVFGAIGAAAGVGLRSRSTRRQLVDAMGIAASMAGGIIEYLADGAWTKRMHPGWAAQSGYRAARMAQGGVRRTADRVRGQHGFFHGFAHTRDGNYRGMLEGFGAEWLAAGIAFKLYACGTMAHPYIDCARQLVAPGLDPNDVQAIECETAEGIVHRCGNRSPTSSGRRTAMRQSSASPTRSPWPCCATTQACRVRRCRRAGSKGAGARRQSQLSNRPGQPVSSPVHRPLARHAAKRRCARGAAGPLPRRRRRAVGVRRHRHEVSSQRIPWRREGVST
jgi:hypothetical protein